jgi:membrane-bound serine protease (ClpP class)
MGKKLTLDADGRQFKTAASPTLLQQEGEALSPLRPAGLALLGGQRVDVVAESSWIPAGARIRVIEVAGNRIVVRQVEQP